MKIRKIASTLIIALAAATLMSANALASTKNSGSTDTDSICTTCSGHGTSACTWCKGTGQMSAAGTSYTCVTCSGTGNMQCLGCSGTGRKREFNTTRSSTDTGSTCATCSGMGTTDCTWCKGTGLMSAAGTSYTCVTCSGTGSVQCLGCSGTGKKRELKKEAPSTASAAVTANPETSFNTSGVSLSPSTGTFGYQTGTLCSICNGAGERVCQSCSGNGFTTTMKQSANYGAGSTPYWVDHSCAACHSSGRVPCTYCGGDGVR